MTNEMKLLTAFIGASGFDIEILTPKAEDFKWQFKGQPSNNLTPLCVDYKVTKKVKHYKHHGDYFSFGCAVLSEDLQKTLHKEGVDCGDNDIRNVCKAIIDTVMFHIKKD